MIVLVLVTDGIPLKYSLATIVLEDCNLRHGV
jgi:hypothetical protein